MDAALVKKFERTIESEMSHAKQNARYARDDLNDAVKNLKNAKANLDSCKKTGQDKTMGKLDRIIADCNKSLNELGGVW